MNCILVLIVWLGVVFCNAKLERGDLDLELKSANEGIDYYEANFDNVFYSYYKPKKGNKVKSLSESSQTIWDSEDQTSTCKYALVAYKNIDPYLVYILKSNEDGLSDSFYQKSGSKWKKIDLDAYKYQISVIKMAGNYRPVTVFLANLDHSPSYYVHNFEGKLKYRFFSLKYGFGASRVFYKNEVWSSEDKEDRCVAVWAYQPDGVNIEYVKMLVTSKFGRSKVLDYVLTNNKWHLCVPDKEYPNRPKVEYLENFIHPEYHFVNKEAEIKLPKIPPDMPENTYVFNNDPSVIFIGSLILNSHVQVYKEDFDDVQYHHYYPKSPDSVIGIYDSTEKIWRSCAYETCKYALVALEDDKPVMAYLYLKFDSDLRCLYMRKTLKGWIRSNLIQYNVTVNAMKSAHKYVELYRLDLYSNFHNKYYDISMGSDYIMYTARCGVRITAVSYGSQEIWTGPKGERCVAVWAYHNGYYHTLKLLVSDRHGSELLTYYRMYGIFRRVEEIQMRKSPLSEKAYFIKVDGVEHALPPDRVRMVVDPPRSFYHPEYDFTPKIREIENSYPLDNYEHIYEGYENIYGPEANNYMMRLAHPIYTRKNCIEVNVAAVYRSLATVSDAVYDKSLFVKYIMPYPGSYFSKITYEGDIMYSQMSPADASVGVAVYVKNFKPTLADVLLASSRPASIHLEKVGGIWRYISKREFDEKLTDLKEFK